MRRADYLAQLQALLPPGAALPREPGAPFTRLLDVAAGELERVEGRAAALLAEADPRSTTELLPDWERVAGLPDPCLGPAPTLEARRRRLVQQLTQRGGQRPRDFVALAAALGYAWDQGPSLELDLLSGRHAVRGEVEIVEHRQHSCERSCESPVNDLAWAFAWTVRAAPSLVTESTAEDHCETPLATWGDAVLECVVRRLVPPHTHVLFAYGGS